LAAADVDMAHWVARFGHGAEQHRDSDAAVPFLCWIAIHGRDSKDVKEALDILVADHVDSSALLAAVEEPSWTYRTIPPEQSIPILRHIADESPFDVVRAYAYYELARVMKRSKPDDAAAIEEADAMLRKAERFAVGTDLELVIQAPSFEAERLQIGMEVPDIVGEDLERIPFRLSDYRGKVVVLDFWGDW